MNRRAWAILCVVVAMACGDDSPHKNANSAANNVVNNVGNNVANNTTNSATNNATNNVASCDPGRFCGDYLCGRHFAPGCGEVECGSCRYEDRYVGDGALAMAPDGGVWVLSLAGSAELILPDGTTERAAELEGIESPRMAVDGQGRVHVVGAKDDVFYAVRTSEESWTVTQLHENAENDEALEIALDGDSPVIFRKTSALAMDIYEMEAGNLVPTTVTDVQFIGPIRASFQAGRQMAAALGATGTQTLGVIVEKVSGVWTTETLPSTERRVVDVAVLARAEAPVAVALTGNYTLRTGAGVATFERGEMGWVGEEVAMGWENGLALQADDQGQPVSFYSVRQSRSEVDNVVYLTRVGYAPWRVGKDCDRGVMDLRYGPDGRAHMLMCGTYRVAVGRYSEAYDEACVEVASTLCAKACECGNSNCCYTNEDDSGAGCSFGPGDTGRQICEEKFREKMCGDPTMQEAPLMACDDSLTASAPVCQDTAVVVNATCASVRN